MEEKSMCFPRRRIQRNPPLTDSEIDVSISAGDDEHSLQLSLTVAFFRSSWNNEQVNYETPMSSPTWHGEEEFDAVLVAVEGELCLSQIAVRNEGSIRRSKACRSLFLENSFW